MVGELAGCGAYRSHQQIITYKRKHSKGDEPSSSVTLLPSWVLHLGSTPCCSRGQPYHTPSFPCTAWKLIFSPAKPCFSIPSPQGVFEKNRDVLCPNHSHRKVCGHSVWVGERAKVTGNPNREDCCFELQQHCLVHRDNLGTSGTCSFLKTGVESIPHLGTSLSTTNGAQCNSPSVWMSKTTA